MLTRPSTHDPQLWTPDRLRAMRLGLGLTQEEFAWQIYVNSRGYGSFERGSDDKWVMRRIPEWRLGEIESGDWEKR